MQQYIFLLSLCLWVSMPTSAQTHDSIACKKPIAQVTATINNFGNKKIIYISEDSIRYGFKITLSDTSYKVIGFGLIFWGRYGDVYTIDILGAEANDLNLPILKQRFYPSDKIAINCITISKNKRLYNTSTPVIEIVIKP